jgi:acetoin utilization deacetylase AcuC-like enzyme
MNIETANAFNGISIEEATNRLAAFNQPPVEEGAEIEEEVTEELVEETEATEEEIDYLLSLDYKGEVKNLTKSEVEVLVKEALAGETRQSNYTKKFQELSVKEQEILQKEQTLTTELQWVSQAKQELDYISSAFNQPPITNQQLKELLDAGDIDGFQRAKFNLDNWTQSQQAIMQKRQQLEAFEQHKQAEVLNNQRLQAKQYLEVHKPEVLKNANEVRSFLTAQGYTDQEIDTIADPRAFITAYEAMMYKKSLEKATQIQKKDKPIQAIKSNGKITLPQSNESQLQARLKDSGSVDDAAALIGMKLFKK